MKTDFCIIGGGIAGLSLAYELSSTADVTVVEREPDLAYHTTGRSAALYTEAFFDGPALSLSKLSRSFFVAPPDEFADHSLYKQTEIIVTAKPNEREQLSALHESMPHLHRMTTENINERVPYIRTGPDDVCEGLLEQDGFRIDVASLVAGYRRGIRTQGANIRCNTEITKIGRDSGKWKLALRSGEEIVADTLINAAGAWGDVVAGKADVNPIGLTPLSRTIITFDGPNRADCSGWPIVGGVGADYYFGPEAGRLMGSAADEVLSEPCDAQPDEYSVALAAQNIERHITFPINQIRHKWAGLRTYSPDRQPVVGFGSDTPDFFWLVGQGGFGIQSAPANAKLAAALVCRKRFPSEFEGSDLALEAISPERFG